MGNQSTRQESAIIQKQTSVGALGIAVDHLEKLELILKESVTDLATKIAPISRPEEPTQPHDETAFPSASPVAMELNEVAERIRRSIERIQRLIDLVDL